MRTASCRALGTASLSRDGARRSLSGSGRNIGHCDYGIVLGCNEVASESDQGRGFSDPGIKNQVAAFHKPQLGEFGKHVGAHEIK